MAVVVDKQPETVVVAEKPASVVEKRAEVKEVVDDEPAAPLQAAPFVLPDAAIAAMAQQPSAIPEVVALDLNSAAATARTQELTEAAVAVAETILVTPSLVHGEGQMTIRLKPTVLDGSEIRLEAKGAEISISVQPATTAVAQLVEQSKARFEQALAERLPSFQVVVSVHSLRSSTVKGPKDSDADNT